MSFGFGVGDFLAVLDLANRVRKKWNDAPEEFNAMNDEIRNVSALLENVHKLSQQGTLSDEHITQINDSSANCRRVLQRCETLVDKFPSAAVGQSSLKSKWKRLLLDPDDVRVIRDQLVSCVSSLTGLLMSIQSFQVSKIKTGVASIGIRDTRVLLNTVADWFSSDDFGKHQDYHFSLRLPGTGQWALQHSKYKQWQDGDNTTLLCPGIPGSGKSVLHATLVNDLRNQYEHDPDVLVVYFYCSFQRQAEQTTRNILSVLIRQMFQERSQLPEDVKALYEKHCHRKTSPSMNELEELLQSLVQGYRKIFLLMDAMDECMKDENQCIEFLDIIFAIQQQETSAKSVNLLVTTRWLPRIIEHFGTSPQMEIKARQEDIEQYLDHNIPRLPVKSHVKIKLDDTTVTIRDAIKSRIVARADGMFLLARLQFDSLTDKTNPRKLQQALLRLESGSGALWSEYDKALLRIDQQREGFRELAYKVLTWIVYARKELSIIELQEATAIYEGMEDVDHDTDLEDVEQLASVCAGLVRIDHDAGVLRLVHYTTQEYLKSVLPDQNKGEIAIAKDCLTYLSMSIFEQPLPEEDSAAKDQLQRYKLFQYAVEYWGKHIQPDFESELIENIERIFFSPDLFRTAVRFLIADERPGAPDGRPPPYRSKISPAHVCSYFGLTSTLFGIIDKGKAIDGKDSKDQTPLSWAADYGHAKIANILLKRSHRLDQWRDVYGKTPLRLAIGKGHLDVVEILLQHADVNDYSLGVTAQTEYMTPLHLAITLGHTDIVRLLLQQKGVKVESSRYDGKEVFKEAIWRGHVKTVKVLLDRSELFFKQPTSGTEDTIGVNSEKFDVLSLATRREDAEILKMLLEHPSVHGNPSAFRGVELLQDAIWYGRPECIDYLWSSTDVRSLMKEFDLEAFLYPTVLARQAEIVKVVVKDKSINVGSVNHEGRTILSYAAQHGLLEIVEALLQRPDVNPESIDQNGRSPLSYAAHNSGDGEVVKALLKQAMVRADSRDKQGRTPLSYAAQNGGNSKVFQILLEQPMVQADSRDEKGRTPLSYAAQTIGNRKAVELLLENPMVQADSKDEKGRTPLSYAAEAGSDAIATFLTLPQVNMNGTDKDGLTPFLWAIKSIFSNSVLPFVRHWSLRSNSASIFVDLVRKAIQEMREVPADRRSGKYYRTCNMLGHCVLFLGYRKLALHAFQQEIVLEQDTPLISHESIGCDGCQVYPIEGERFVCVSCPEIDLCAKCEQKHSNGKMLPDCENHEFLRVLVEQGLSKTADGLDQGTQSADLGFLAQHQPLAHQASDSATSEDWRDAVRDQFLHWGIFVDEKEERSD